MEIDLLEKIIQQDIFKYRVCKIKYSAAFENCLKEKLILLNKRYNIYSIDELFSNIKGTSEYKGKARDWGIGILKNLLGLIPGYGSAITILFSISDTINFIKISDLEKLTEKFKIKEKPRKKYRKIKNVIIIDNVSYLNMEQIKTICFIKELIDKKYIVDTLLVICEPLIFPSNISVDKEAIYTLFLDNSLLQRNFKVSVKDEYLNLINILGIEYLEYIIDLDKEIPINNDILTKKIISDMLHKSGYACENNLLDFLKLCSLLFDVFSYEDAEKISDIKKICCEKEIKKTIDSKIFISDIPNKYRFFISFVRKYYQNDALLIASDIKTQILSYLKEKYPDRYADLALTSILTSNSETEKISLCLKALYYNKEDISIYKIDEIKSFLSKIQNKVIGSIIQLNDVYYSLDYSNIDAKNLCIQSLLGLSDLNTWSPEDKLICLSYIAKVSYELMPQSFLLEIDCLYRKLLRDIRISTTYNKNVFFILDYLVFSTCIENNYKTTEVVQRLVSYLQKSNLTAEYKIKYSRIGNALFYNDYSKGLMLTEQAYVLSMEYPVEHKCATINYSCSLGMCGEYERAQKVLFKEFNNTFCKKNAITISAQNNYIIVSYLNKSYNNKKLIDEMDRLNKSLNCCVFSDQQIIYNNLLAAYIEDDVVLNHKKIEELNQKIYCNESDTYHLFFMHHNMMTFYFLNGNVDAFLNERKLCDIPGLLLPYDAFFKAKTDFLQENIGNMWNISQLQKNLVLWGERYSEKKYALYKLPVLFGFIERWFE